MISAENWYARKYIRIEMAKLCKWRYVSCQRYSDPTKLNRYFSGYTDELFEKLIDFNKVTIPEQPLKLYSDLAQYKDGKMPTFSWNFVKKAEQRQEWLDKGREDAFLGLDFAIDIDAPKGPNKAKKAENWPVAWKAADKVKKHLEGLEMPYSVWFSGGGGFAFKVPHQYFKKLKGKKPKKWEDHHHKLAEDMAIKLKIPPSRFDTKIYNYDRVFSLPYSYAPSGYIVLPLSDYQFDNFNIRMVEPETVLSGERLVGRGMLWRNLNGLEI